MTMMATERIDVAAPGWTKASGTWETQDGRFAVSDFEEGKWWLVERMGDGTPLYHEPFDLFRELKAAVAAIYAEELEKTNDLLLEVDEIEAGDGTIFRLRLRDGWDNTFATAYARRGQIGLELGATAATDVGPEMANAVAAMLQQAAALAESQQEGAE